MGAALNQAFCTCLFIFVFVENVIMFRKDVDLLGKMLLYLRRCVC